MKVKNERVGIFKFKIRENMSIEYLKNIYTKIAIYSYVAYCLGRQYNNILLSVC